MNRMLVGTLLVLSATLIGAQLPQGQDRAAPSAQVAENSAQTGRPDQPHQDKTAGNDRIQSNLQSALDGDPALRGADLTASVDDERITLTGSVQSYLQHQRVLELVSPYGNYREIVDKVTVQ
jgi:osmotically-inducible protein OsmY